MKYFFLDEPEFSEPNGRAVKLVLRNNIVMRNKIKTETLLKKVSLIALNPLSISFFILWLFEKNNEFKLFYIILLWGNCDEENSYFKKYTN